MNILFLTGNMAIGGTELYALDYAKSMQNNGHNVYWASISKGEMCKIAIQENIKLLHCSFEKRFPWLFLKSMQELYKIYINNNIDIIHAIDAYTAMIAVFAFRNKKNKPKIVWSSVGIGSSSYSLMKKYCDKYIDQIIAPSHFIRNRMIEENFQPEKIIVYSQSRKMKDSNCERNILRKQFNLSDDDFVLGSIGRIVRMKGNKTIILALNLIIKQFPNTKFMLVGDGQEKTELKKLVNKLNINDNVIFTCFRTDIENMYKIFDMVVFPTYYEALGYIPIEAMYYEKPIIASYTGGIPEIIINNYNGMLVPPAMTEKWAESITKLITDKKLIDKFTENGKKYYDKHLAFDEKHEKLEKIYKSVLNIN